MSTAVRRAVLVLTAAVGMLAAQTGLAASLNLASTALTPYRTCVVTGTPTDTLAVVDTEVRENMATTNYGTQGSNDVESSSAKNRRLYIRFDLSLCNPVIPASATVRLATMRLFVTGRGSSCRTIDIFRVPTTWTETGITWNNQPFGTSINNPASGTATDTFGIGNATGCENVTNTAYIVGATVTADVAAFIAGAATNYGWMLRDDVEGAAPAVTETFSSNNVGSAARAPQLVITYVTVT